MRGAPAARLREENSFTKMRCCICYSEKEELSCEFIECASGHATCADCFNEHVKVETAKAAGCVSFSSASEKERKRDGS